MSDHYDAIVVGGGLAGLTSAAYLCKYGYRTLLIEKSVKTGGLVSTFRHQGYAFDAGIRAFENSGIILPMLKSLGIDIELVENPVSIGIENEWTRLHSRDSLQAYATMLEGFFPESKAEITQIAELITKVMGYMDVLYGIDNPLFLEDFKDREYLMKTLLPWLLRYQVNIKKAMRLDEPVGDYLRRITDNQALIDMIAQHFFKKTPTFFAMSYFGLYLDYSYPKGGTGVLAQKLTDYIVAAGGEILTGTTVSGVDIRNKQISTTCGSYSYRKLVWAADQKALYASLVGGESVEIEKQRTLAQKGSGGDSILTLFMGVNLDKVYFNERCGTHAFYTPKTIGLSTLKARETAGTQEALYDWVGKYLELTTYEISCPVLRDETLAPEGKTGVIVSTLMDYSLVRKFYEAGEYEAFKNFCIRKISDVLSRSLFPGIIDKTEFTICGTPLTIEKETGNSEGAITGWAFTSEQMPAVNKFQKIATSIKTPVEDVFQCGQWTFSPSGLPVSILTGKLAADAVRKKLKGRDL